MTNPNDALGTPSAYNGRTSVNGYNTVANSYTAGVLLGFKIKPDGANRSIQIGGDTGIQDIAIAANNENRKSQIINRNDLPAILPIAEAHPTMARISSIVAYIAENPHGDGETQDNPTACGLLEVQGVPATNPVAPTAAEIKAAVIADGGGTNPYIVELGKLRVGAGATQFETADVTNGDHARPNIRGWSTLATFTGSTASAYEAFKINVGECTKLRLTANAVVSASAHLRLVAPTSTGTLNVMTYGYTSAGTPGLFFEKTSVTSTTPSERTIANPMTKGTISWASHCSFETMFARNSTTTKQYNAITKSVAENATTQTGCMYINNNNEATTEFTFGLVGAGSASWTLEGYQD